MSKQGKHWTLAVLEQRGWPLQLVQELLPPPNYLTFNGRSFRYWKRDVVLEAERTLPFLQRNGQLDVEPPPPPPGPAELAEGAQRVRSALDASWAAGRDEGDFPPLVRQLAERYHWGILSILRKKPRKLIRDNQAIPWLGEFLSLERRRAPEHLPEIFQKLTQAAPWIDRNPDHDLARRAVERYPRILLRTAKRMVDRFLAAQPETHLAGLLSAPAFPACRLVREGLDAVWSGWYVPQAIRTSLSLLTALHPKDEYPEARRLRRRFILHIGGANTGKTYTCFQRLRQAENGVYLAPLRLLALEAQDTLLNHDVSCALSTGEEEDVRPEDTHLAATTEKLDLRQHYEVAVIDECQMIADPQRGYAWTRAILGVLAPEVHLCAAPEAQDLLLRLIASCGDQAEVIRHERTTPLVCMSRPLDFQRLQPGDALITFSKAGVLNVAEELRQNGLEPAIIYGALPYAARRRQMDGFLAGRMQYLVATDAIGMGLNLPIQRVIFLETEKYDGVTRRPLTPAEIQQIAGRAGRYGMYSKGFVGATRNLAAIRAALEAPVPPLEYAVTGFPQLVLDSEFDLLEVLKEWSQLPTAEPFRKLDVTRYITVLTKIRDQGFQLGKELELRAANIPFDEEDPALWEHFLRYLRRWQQGEAPDIPVLRGEDPSLPELELHYRKLDLCFSFARAFSFPVDSERLFDCREETADAINEILLYRLRNNIRFCACCGRSLPLPHQGQLCSSCWKKRLAKRKPPKR
ncbi:MAG: hypothetical protein HFG00_10190 [Oscillibacter sp.]|nr:hypothetical protein [Oscillibacter sp.]